MVNQSNEAAEINLTHNGGQYSEEILLLAELISRSEFFDVEAYGKNLPGANRAEDLALHYLTVGERAGLAPSRLFEPRFYAASNADVQVAAVNRLGHFLVTGRSEGRYPTRELLSAHAEMVLRSSSIKLLDAIDGNAPSSDRPALTNIESYLNNGWKNDPNIFANFDSHLFNRYFPDHETFLPPVVRFLKNKKSSFYPVSAEELSTILNVIRPEFDEAWYRQRYQDTDIDYDPLHDYVQRGWKLGRDPNGDFSSRNYLAKYPDIVDANVEPFFHFILTGRQENRVGSLSHPDRKVGDAIRDPSRNTILIATHESSRTGAPLVALGLTEQLSKEFNVIVHSGKSGELSDAFLKHSVLTFTGSLNLVESQSFLRSLNCAEELYCVVMNCAETFNLSFAARAESIPSVALIHEFAEYSSGHVRMMLENADSAIFPAALLVESAERDVKAYGRPNNVLIRHQGRLPSLPIEPHGVDMSTDELLHWMNMAPGDPLIVGAGWAQIRKGLDLFVQTAAEVRLRVGSQIRFLWVGENYKPKEDMGYSVYVEETLNRLNLQDCVFFLPAQQDLGTIFEISKVFFLSSRLDPYPNVVLDAWAADLPVVCFEGATGVAENILNGAAVGAAVDYCNVSKAATAICQFLEASNAASGQNKALIAREYDFADYGRSVGDAVLAARTRCERVHAEVEKITNNRDFDAVFYSGGADSAERPERAAYSYVGAALNGLSICNPRPGFSDNLYRSRVKRPDGAFCPLTDAAARKDKSTTHKCIVLPEFRMREPFEGKVAIYLQALSGDFIQLVANMMNECRRSVDVFVSGPADVLVEAKYAFRHYSAGTVEVDLSGGVDDRFEKLTRLVSRDQDRRYDVIGAFCDKRVSVSKDALSGAQISPSSDVSLLLGEVVHRETIWSLFSDPKLGLVFPEDHHAMQWVDKSLANALASHVSAVIPSAPHFPFGSAFWVRPAVLVVLAEVLKRFREQKVQFGRIAHLDETVNQLLPSLCNSLDLDWVTVYKQGWNW